MILPPEEAKQKVCPFMSKAVAVAEVGSWIEKQHCLADGCMAWRWAELRSPQEYADRKPSLPYTPKPAGFCGATSG